MGGTNLSGLCISNNVSYFISNSSSVSTLMHKLVSRVMHIPTDTAILLQSSSYVYIGYYLLFICCIVIHIHITT